MLNWRKTLKCKILSLDFFSPICSINSTVFNETVYRWISIKDRLTLSSDHIVGLRPIRCRDCWCFTWKWRRFPAGANSMGRRMFNRLQYYRSGKFWIRNTYAHQHEVITKQSIRLPDCEQIRFRPSERGESHILHIINWFIWNGSSAPRKHANMQFQLKRFH